MIDIKLLRENFEWVRSQIAKKKFSCDFEAIFELDKRRREVVARAQSARAEQKEASQEMTTLDKASQAFQDKIKALKAFSTEVKKLEEEEKRLDQAWQDLLLTIPNLPDASVPEGKNENDNQEIDSWGDKGKLISPYAKAHFSIEGFDEWVDFSRGAKVTGAGFPFYKGDMARLVRALVQFFLQEAHEKGYEELLSPLLVNSKSATTTGQLPDKEGQMYEITRDELYMIPTAEIPVTNFYRDETFAQKELPKKHAAYTPCFRREAGSWGAHVRGLNRLHQFDKVELVQWVHPEKSFEALEELKQHAEGLLKKLNLPYRVLLICSGDIGFPHSKQYDLEVWAGGQERWLEVSSCSNFTDFQARRANTRFKPKNGGKSELVHTLNGSGLAVPRVLAALLENNLQADGRVKIPAVLKPWYKDEYIGFSHQVASNC